MPVKKENRARYPKNWNEIRTSILGRANNRCEFCKAENRTLIVRGTGKHIGTYHTIDERIFCAKTGQELTGICQTAADYENTGKAIEVVLTIAHLDHTPENCDPANLKALCQKCHLDYDRSHHLKNAALTRASKKNAGADLFTGGAA